LTKRPKCYIFCSDEYPDIVLYAVKRYLNVLIEGPPQSFFDQSTGNDALHNEMKTRGGPIAVMYVRSVRIYAHRYFCVVPTPVCVIYALRYFCVVPTLVCVIYANCSYPFYFSTRNDHVSSLRSIPLLYLLKLNSELFFFHVIFLYVFPSRAPRVRHLRLIVIPPYFVVDTK
jgi:hypothetical protein